MDKKIYLIFTATFLFLTDSSYRVNIPAKIINTTKTIETAGDKSVGNYTGKVFVTNVTCGGNLSN